MAFLLAQFDGNLDFDALIESIRGVFPETSVIKPDYYADLLARQKAFAREQGWKETIAPIECTERVAAEMGLQRQIRVPIRPGLSLTGRIDRYGCFFTADWFLEQDVAPLAELLTAAGLEVEVVAAKE